MVARRALEGLEARARGRQQRFAFERRGDLLPFSLELLQREMQSAAPFVERRVRLCKKPWNAGYVRKVDLAACAAPRLARSRQRRIAARAGENFAERVGSRLCGRFVAQGRDRGWDSEVVPVHRSRYVKAAGEKRTTVTRPSLAE